MNKFCLKNCAYNDICNLNAEHTAQCKVADDKDAQDFRRSTIMGIKTKNLIAMQYKNKKNLAIKPAKNKWRNEDETERTHKNRKRRNH